MEFGLSDSSGTDDDLPPSHKNRFQRAGHAAGNGRSAVGGSAPLPRMHADMETQIHHIEQEAHSSILRAFKAQSDAITWDKESLITELRKELRVSDEQRKELLSQVNADDIIRKIREWRKARGVQPGRLNATQPVHGPTPSPTVSASRKKPKTSQSVAPLSLGEPSPAMHPSVQPSSLSALRRAPPGARNKKPKSYPSIGLTGRAQVGNRCSSGTLETNALAETALYDPLIGRKGRHALVYDINTVEKTWEWVNLKKISPEYIKWECENPRVSSKSGHTGPGRGIKKSIPQGGAITSAGRGRGSKGPRSQNHFSLPHNAIGKKAKGDIKIVHTDTLIKEVEKAFGANYPDPLEIEKAKTVLKEHEQALVNAIETLEDASDGESDGEYRFLRGAADRTRMTKTAI